MANNLTQEEKETIILFNEADNTASVTTFNGALIRKLSALCETRPDEATGKGPDESGEFTFTIPKRWIRVNAGQILTDEQKLERSDRGKRNAAHFTRNSR
jgi:hypothetical protein